MDEFTPDILILGYSRLGLASLEQKFETFSLTGLSPSMVGLSRAVLLTFEFVTSYLQLTTYDKQPTTFLSLVVSCESLVKKVFYSYYPQLHFCRPNQNSALK